MKGNGSRERASASVSMHALTQSYTDALEGALGDVVARSQTDLSLLKERTDAIIATAHARIAEAEARLHRIELAIIARLESIKDGVDGKDGVPGERGPEGPQGPPGAFPVVTGWEDRVHYSGALVTLLGATWQALRDTGSAPPHADWLCLARGGEDGRSFVIRGTWSEAEIYRELDVVALNGASFAARRADPGACPGDGWQLIAAQGKRGNAGERGTSGKGERGTPGPAAVALEVSDEGLLTLTNADGSRATCDLYPLLAKLV